MQQRQQQSIHQGQRSVTEVWNGSEQKNKANGLVCGKHSSRNVFVCRVVCKLQMEIMNRTNFDNGNVS